MSAESPHVFTLTCNLLAERTLEFAGWSPGRTQRAVAESFQVGGKGINVSKMLTRLQTLNTALCFTGGPTGAECEAWLCARNVFYRSFATATPTRSGTVVRDTTHAQRETTFLGLDAPPDLDAIRACAEFLDAQPAGQVLVLCGSVPGWADERFDPLRAAFERWQQRGHLIADTYGPPLAWFAARPIALVKINADELRTLGGRAALASNNLSARRWVVSDGAASVWLRDEGGSQHTLTPPPVTEVSATGSGDVLLACILHAFFVRRLSLRDAVHFAIPYAAANAAHPGIAEFPMPK